MWMEHTGLYYQLCHEVYILSLIDSVVFVNHKYKTKVPLVSLCLVSYITIIKMIRFVLKLNPK